MNNLYCDTCNSGGSCSNDCGHDDVAQEPLELTEEERQDPETY